MSTNLFDELAGRRRRPWPGCTIGWNTTPQPPSCSTSPTAPSTRPVGTLLLAATTAGLVRVAYDVEGHDAVLASWPTRISPRVLRAPARLDAAARQIDEYFAKRRTVFEVPVDLRLAEGFRRNVIEHLRDIGYGRRESYAEVAAAIGSPRAVRAVGTACAPQPAAGGDPLPPRRALRRVDGSVRRRRRGQVGAARPGGRLTGMKRRARR